jgi:hypothetical protein
MGSYKSGFGMFHKHPVLFLNQGFPGCGISSAAFTPGMRFDFQPTFV